MLKTLPVIPSLRCWVKIAGYFHIFHVYNPYKEKQQGPQGSPAPWSTGVPKTLCWVPDWMQLQTTRVSWHGPGSQGKFPWCTTNVAGHGGFMENNSSTKKPYVININGGYKHTYLWGIYIYNKCSSLVTIQFWVTKLNWWFLNRFGCKRKRRKKRNMRTDPWCMNFQTNSRRYHNLVPIVESRILCNFNVCAWISVPSPGRLYNHR